MFLVCLVISASVAPVPAGAAVTDPKPSRRELRAVEERGKLIVELDLLAARSTDLLAARGLRMPDGGLYICSREATGPRCAFGTLRENRATFALAYLVDANLELVHFQVPREERGWLVQAASAVLDAARMFPFDERAEAYNHIVVAERDNAISVYFVPATKADHVRVMGADGVVRITAAGDGEVLRFHQELRVTELSSDSGEFVAGAHTHAQLSAPNPLDVYYAMTAPGGSEYVLGRNWVFEIDNSGSIRSMGSTEAFIRKLRRSKREEPENR